MTKELYNKCRNPLMQAFCALDAETQKALAAARFDHALELLDGDNAGEWIRTGARDEISVRDSRVYRISDKAAPPPEPQWVDVPVHASQSAPRRWYIERNRDQFLLSHMPDFCDFEGIVYECRFIPLEPYNPKYGLPVSVRFRK